MKRLLLTFLLGAILATGLCAQEHHYRLWFSDKAGSTYSLDRPEEFLSPQAIARREKRNIAIDSTDLPIEPTRLHQISQIGTRIIATSRWLNTATIAVDDIALLPTLLALPFVKQYDDLGSPISLKTTASCTPKKLTEESISPYGEAYWQIALHNGDKLHQAGFKGKGVTIAVIDAGFRNVYNNPIFNSAHIIGAHDFVDIEMDFIHGDDHGSKVLSTMLGNDENLFVGTAPEANYWLLRSENTTIEIPTEEDYWATALEYADSLGIELITTSLGYYLFDNARYNHTWEQLDGKTAFISQAAAMGVGKGLLILASAGNEGGNQWQKITFPADVDGVLSVGAVTPEKQVTFFSGRGFTADHRIKPDVAALGESVTIIAPDGTRKTESGTSYSTPILAGLTACLWQALPDLSAQEIIDLIKRNSSQYLAPDSLIGYGIPDFQTAYQQGAGIENISTPDSPLQITYHNGKPVARFECETSVDTCLTIRIFNTEGSLVKAKILTVGNELKINNLPSGVYLLVARGKSNYWTYKIQCP